MLQILNPFNCLNAPGNKHVLNTVNYLNKIFVSIFTEDLQYLCHVQTFLTNQIKKIIKAITEMNWRVPNYKKRNDYTATNHTRAKGHIIQLKGNIF